RSVDMIFPPPEAFQSLETLEDFEAHYGAFGGQFRIQLARYLIRSRPKDFDVTLVDEDMIPESNLAWASVPPSLIGQGGPTQPEWLYQFLLNPQPVRKMTVLRMPRFNISEEEAQALVAYFTATERLVNPRFQVQDGPAAIPQQAALSESFWQKRNARYLNTLKKEKLYDQRLKELEPLWELIQKEYQRELKEAEARLEELVKQFNANQAPE